MEDVGKDPLGHPPDLLLSLGLSTVDVGTSVELLLSTM